MYIIIEDENIYLSYQFLQSNGISEMLIARWNERKVCIRKKIYKHTYVLYSSIPKPSIAKLPSEATLKKMQVQYGVMDKYVDTIKDNIHATKAKHYDYIMSKYPFTDTQVQGLAKTWAVIEPFSKSIQRGHSEIVRKAINTFLDNRFSCDAAFSRFYTRLQRAGIEDAVIDKRLLPISSPVLKFGDFERKFIANLLSDGRKFCFSEIREKMIEAFEPEKRNVPSMTWIQDEARHILKNTGIYGVRYGKDKVKETLPYQLLKPSDFTNVQWQIDGWTIPFFTKSIDASTGKQIIKRWVVVRVIDNGSSKILGYTVSQTENIHSIMGALKMAIKNTQTLPHEIIMDKHTAGLTKTFSYFKSKAAAMGCNIIDTITPTGKAYIEVDNRYLNKILKMHFVEWIGEGATSKRGIINTQDNLRKLYTTQNALTTDELFKRIDFMCNKFNSEMKVRRIDYKTPNEVYTIKDNKGYLLSEAKINQLTIEPIQITVQRRMIHVSKGIKRNAYTLPVAIADTYQNEKVNIFYEDMDVEIFVFDKNNEKHICTLTPDVAVSNVISERTEAPKTLGKINGIKKAHALDSLIENDPKALLLFNGLNLSKTAQSTVSDYKEKMEEIKKTSKAKKERVQNVNEISNEDLNDNTITKLESLGSLKQYAKQKG
jgi:hypothetical protein